MGDASDFLARTDELRDLVGEGELVINQEIDQVYAHVQHEALDYKHPHGGEAKFEERALFDGYRKWYDRFARAVGDRPLDDVAIEVAEDFVTDTEMRTPIEFGDLAQSGHPSVTSDGATVYDRPPVVHRLTDEELDAKSDILHPVERGEHAPHPGRGHGPRTYLPKSHPEHGKTYNRPK